MPRQIHKFPLRVSTLATGDAQIEMPYKHRILTAREQGDDICVWAEVDTTSPMIARRFRVVGTGHDAPGDATYIGTAMLLGGRLVLHVYAYD